VGEDAFFQALHLQHIGTRRDLQRLWERGRWADIHRYCADDAVQTYFILLRVEQLRGTLTSERVAELTAAAQASLRGSTA